MAYKFNPFTRHLDIVSIAGRDSDGQRIKYDSTVLTYIILSDGWPYVETITYKLGGKNGTIVAVATIGYNKDNDIESVVTEVI